jgi:hypothetical protein
MLLVRPLTTIETRGRMEIRMEKVLELIKQRSRSDQLRQAERKPPDLVGPERDSVASQTPGLEPQDRLSRPGGDVPGL